MNLPASPPAVATVHLAFEHLRSVRIGALDVRLHEYRHRGTGARHFHIESADDNNAFVVAFPTVPQDSTGIAHILEHTALCGSERYPVRDPFFMMLRRSLNTFMNAFTSSDATAYPFASRNRRDFENLLAVYLDAVFFPRLDPLDFAQEGHRVDFERSGDTAAPLVQKGVVYNEMKGAMSSPVARLWQSLQSGLFPTTTYHWNSGGEPAAIPGLTHSALRAFHATHYHPSNAVFVTYGSFPVAGHHALMDELALARFDAAPEDLRVPPEARFEAPRAVTVPYAVGQDDEEAAAYVQVGWLLGETTDLDACLSMHLLSGVLLGNAAAPLRHALETSDLGSAPAPICGLDDSTREATLACGLEGARSADAERIEALILDVLRTVAAEGVDPRLTSAVLHQMELAQRDFGSGEYPYGLQLAGRILPVALNGGDPFTFLDLDPAIARLREAAADPAYIPGLVRRWLLDNPHRLRLVLEPDPTLRSREQAEERARLDALASTLDAAGRQSIVALNEALEARQRTQDDPEVLPRVGLADVPLELRVPSLDEHRVGGLAIVRCAAGTNGIVHQRVVVELPALDAVQQDLLAHYWSFVTEVGVADEDYRAAQATQAATGMLSAGVSVRPSLADPSQLGAWFTLTGRGLARNHRPLADLQRRTLLQARFDELDRLRDLVAQTRAEVEAGLTEQGHRLALLAASRTLGPAAALEERWEGPHSVLALAALDESLAGEGAALARFGAALAEIRDLLVAAPRHLVLVTEEDRLAEMEAELARAWGEAPSGGEGGPPFATAVTPGRVAEAWVLNSDVAFCASVWPTVPSTHPDAPALHVLGGVLVNGYLHRAVREQGGAYGAGARYDGDSGAFRLYSYRDPRLAGTLADFHHALEWLDGLTDPRAVEEAILGVIRTLDQPAAPAVEALREHDLRLHGRTTAFRRDLRARVLDVSIADLRRVAGRYLAPGTESVAVLIPADRAGEAEGLGLEVRQLD